MFRFLFVLCSCSILIAACSPNNVTIDDSIKKYFDQHKVTGTFAIFDNGQGEFTIYNLPRYTDSAYLPASTFKIVNSLIALETGVVANDSAIIPWNGVAGWNTSCNKDLPMYQAFRYSCVPWFQELARQIGKDTMQRWMDSLGYAARYGRAVVNKIDTFWLDNSVKTTADEQLGLVKKLYFDQLPFKKWTQRRVRSMMMMDSTDKYKLAYKTGWGFRENGNSIGWVVGWIEENRHPYPFVLQVESADTAIDMRTVRMAILDSVFNKYGFKQGKK
ncbi:MAG TPA: penicillin-binding transpeptidase domain-containing protein [Chitinophagaceae bacterium]|nr:penicillin-binding transpeptidase domain-containing protein [Chitinophagaceae bacterium]